jgi:hypothetical protein
VVLAPLAAATGVPAAAVDFAGNEAGADVVVPQLLRAVQARAQVTSQCLVLIDRRVRCVFVIVTYSGRPTGRVRLISCRRHGAPDGALRRSSQRNSAASHALAARLLAMAGGAPTARISSPPRKSRP